MKATEVIEKIKEQIKIHGDLEVLFQDDYDNGPQAVGNIWHTDDIDKDEIIGGFNYDDTQEIDEGIILGL